MNTAAVQGRLVELATDIGYLKRRAAPGSTIEFLAERLAGHVEALHNMVHPSAAEVVGMWAPGDEEAVDEAIHLMDEDWGRLKTLLRGRAA